jgi:hypothetical protein
MIEAGTRKSLLRIALVRLRVPVAVVLVIFGGALGNNFLAESNSTLARILISQALYYFLLGIAVGALLRRWWVGIFLGWGRVPWGAGYSASLILSGELQNGVLFFGYVVLFPTAFSLAGGCVGMRLVQLLLPRRRLPMRDA